MPNTTAFETTSVFASAAPNLPLAYGAGPTYTYVAFASVPITDLQVGDCIWVTGSGEASTPSGLDSAMVARFAKLTVDPLDRSPSTGIVLDHAKTHNITAVEHHATMTAAGSYTVKAGDIIAAAGEVTVLLVFYAASLTGQVNPASLVGNYADLCVTVARTRPDAV